MDTEIKPGSRKGKSNYSREFKRRLALAACEPGVSVSRLALAHQVNANMVFKWRRDLRAGLLDDAASAPAALLPVVLAETPAAARSTVAPARRDAVPGGMIEIVIADAIVRLRGDVDAALLKTVVQSLRA
ncbi:IS66-like element accessory protein TnpA [Massilia aquatica]|uniref:IS66-like element accessory protein TnpA n=1 Tax=Massilia aquatica TaxID=2609000 RepID=UPI001E331109|nr:transposase [Massilia aquatica]